MCSDPIFEAKMDAPNIGSEHIVGLAGSGATSGVAIDRKSTRLNSSHANISDAVFCLEKKHETRIRRARNRLDPCGGSRLSARERDATEMTRAHGGRRDCDVQAVGTGPGAQVNTPRAR